MRAAKARPPLSREVVVGRRFVVELERVPVARVGDEPGPGDRDQPVVAVEVGDRHEQVERVARRRQAASAAAGWRSASMLPERVVEPAGHVVAAQRRAAAARAAAGAAASASRRVGIRRACAGRVTSWFMSPSSNQRSRSASCERLCASRLREVDAVDPARRRAGDHVDDTRDRRRPDRRRERARGARGRRVSVGRGRLHSALATCRRADEPVDLLGDPVHVDRERGAAVTDEPEP